MSVYSIGASALDIFNLPPLISALDVNTRNEFGATIVGENAGSESTGVYNAFFGYNAGASNKTGSFNTYLGADAARKNVNGCNNVVIGYQAAQNLVSGVGNVIIGNQADANNNGNYNVFIGYLNTAYNQTVSHCNLSLGSFGDISGNNNIVLGNTTTVLGQNSAVFGNRSYNSGTNSLIWGNNIINTGCNVLIINNRHNSNDSNNIPLVNSSNDYLNINDYIIVTHEGDVSTLTLKNDIIDLTSSNATLSLGGGLTLANSTSRLVMDYYIALERLGSNYNSIYLGDDIVIGTSNNLYTSLVSKNANFYLSSNLVLLSNDYANLEFNQSNVIQLKGSNNTFTMCNGGAYLDSTLQVNRNVYLQSNLFFGSNTFLTTRGATTLCNDYSLRITGAGTTDIVEPLYMNNTFPYGVMRFSNVPQGIINWENVSDNERQEFYGSTLIQKNLFVGGATYTAGLNVSDRLLLLSGSNQWSQYVDVTSNLNPYLVFQSGSGTILRFGDNFQPELFNFTGKHRCTMKGQYDNNLKGRIVSATGEYLSLDNKNTVSIDEAIPIIELSRRAYDKTCFGVISEVETCTKKRVFRLGNMEMEIDKAEEDIKVIVNSVGEGGIWVCNANGNLQNGDLVVSSGIDGFGMRQDDDVIRSCTVAKITCDCVFDDTMMTGWAPPLYQYVCGDKTYLVAFVGCTYRF